MKRILSIALLMLCLCAGAAGAEALPQEIADWLARQGYATPVDHLLFDMPDGTRQAFVLTEGGEWLYGFALRDGAWQNISSVSGLGVYQDVRLVRHQAQQLRPDGSAYGDSLGFDIVSQTGAYQSYHCNGEYMTVCGWYDPARYAGSVMVQGTALAYYPQGSQTPEAVADAGDELHSWILDFERCPATPGEGLALAALSQSSLANAFEGYQLTGYEAYNWGADVAASYASVKNGYLFIKRTQWSAGTGMVWESDGMPLPLSRALLDRLETEPWDELIDTSGNASTFLTEDAFDTALIPVHDRVIQSDLQQHALLLLTEDDQGVRRLQVVCADGKGGYRVDAATPPLSADVSLDLFHAGEGTVQLQRSEESVLCYTRGADGVWRLSFASRYREEEDIAFEAIYCGLLESGAWHGGNQNTLRVGTVRMGTLSQADPLALPSSKSDIPSLLDRTGWAVVANPNPADRLHLRTQPDRQAESLGKFYNGTPVQVLAQEGDWCQVSLGLSGLQGWMMTRYLAFGDAMDGVEAAFPQLTYRDEYDDRKPAYADPSDGEAFRMDALFQVIGVVEDEWYILLTGSGQTGYVPQEWLFEGNG